MAGRIDCPSARRLRCPDRIPFRRSILRRGWERSDHSRARYGPFPYRHRIGWTRLCVRHGSPALGGAKHPRGRGRAGAGSCRVPGRSIRAVHRGRRATAQPLPAHAGIFSDWRGLLSAELPDLSRDVGQRRWSGCPRPDASPADLVAHVPLHPERALFRFIHDGIPNTAMAPLGSRMTDDEIWHVVNHIKTLGP